MINYSHEENAAATTMTFKMQLSQITKKIVEEQFQGIYGAEVIYEEELDEDMEKI